MYHHIVAIVSILLLAGGNAQDSLSVDFFTPDTVQIKKDPFNLISSNFGQPAGDYNWNGDQYQLMNRAQRTCNGCTNGGKSVAIQNLTLFVNDKEFFIKAMCYTPVPLGVKSMADNKDGGGRCSNRRTPFATNEYLSACFDSDYYDGGDAPGRVPAAPSNGWFTDLWLRDFPIIKQSGANTIRIYNINPSTRLYTDMVLSGQVTAIDGNIVAPSYGKDHRSFMDAAFNAGLMVIYPLLGDQTLMNKLTKDQYQRYLQNQIDEVGNHPALLMFTLGNELPLSSNPQLLQMVNDYIKFSKDYLMTKWGRSVPFTHAIVDYPASYNTLYEQLEVDVFTSNAGYRGIGFSDLWDGSQSAGVFDGLGPLSLKYNKPNFIGEMGWEQINGTETADPVNAGWFNLKWKDLIQKGTPAGCIGGAFFEYMDEPYTKADPLQQSMGIVSPAVSTAAYKAGPAVPAVTTFPQVGGPTYAASTRKIGGVTEPQGSAPAGSTPQSFSSAGVQAVSFFVITALLLSL